MAHSEGVWHPLGPFASRKDSLSLKTRLPFYLSLVGDGSDTTISIPMLTAPLGLAPVTGSLSPGFGIASAAPTAVSNLVASPQTIVSSSYAFGVLNLTFSVAPGVGVTFTLTGDLEF